MIRNIKHKPSDVCSTQGCGEQAVILDKCKACYNWMHAWSKRTLRDRHAHKRRIDRISARQVELEGSSNLRLVHSRRKEVS